MCGELPQPRAGTVEPRAGTLDHLESLAYHSPNPLDLLSLPPLMARKGICQEKIPGKVKVSSIGLINYTYIMQSQYNL